MNKFISSSKVFFKRNSSTILTFVGAAGVVATSVMAVKATPKALRMIEDAKEEKGEDLTKFETLVVAGPSYIPAAVTGLATIGCIVGANILNKHQQAALTSAYVLLDQSYKDYKKKVNELFGEEADDQVKVAIVKDKYGEREFDLASDKKLYYDMFSEQYFEATPYAVSRAEYEVNRLNVSEGYAYLNDWYISLGIKPLDYGYEFGWSPTINQDRYWQEWIDFKHEIVTMDDGLEVIIIEFMQEPVINFEDYI